MLHAETLLDRLRRKDESVLDYIYEKFYDKLSYSAAGLVDDDQELESALSTAVTELWNGPKDNYKSDAHLLAILRLRIKSRCIDMLRRKGIIDMTLVDPDEMDTFEDLVDDYPDNNEALQRKWVQRMLPKLSKRSRQVIHLYLFDGLRIKDIATKLNIKQGTASNAKDRGVNQLKALWENMTPEEKAYLLRIILLLSLAKHFCSFL